MVKGKTLKKINKKQADNCLIVFMLFCLLILGFYLLPFTFYPLPDVIAADKWQGVDESVVEKYAKEHGREASKPLINIDQGDLPLFLFLLAGVVGGFAAGYYWRRLTEPGDGNKTTGANRGPRKIADFPGQRGGPKKE